MKRLTILAAVVVFGLASCKKDYTCKCESGGSVTTQSYLNVSKSDAEDLCSSLETELNTNIGTGTSPYSCEVL